MSAPAVADPPAENVESLGATFREMFGELFGARELLWQMTVRDLKLRYKQSLMGFGWALLMPLLIVGAGVLVRGAMVHSAGKQIAWTDVATMAVKAVPWAFFVGAVGFAVNSLTSNLNLVTKIYFPREVFPLSAALTQAVDSLVGSVAALGLLLFAGIMPNAAWLWALPLAMALFAFVGGICLLLACGNLFFRDVKYLVQLLLNFGIFFTPVFFEPAALGKPGTLGGWAGWLMQWNPMTPILEGFRLALVEGHSLARPLVDASGFVVWSPWFLLYLALWAGPLALLAWLVFHKLEFVYAEYI